MEAASGKRPRGRPNNAISKQRSTPFRATISAKEMKVFAVKSANLAIPQADLVSASLDDLISPSMFTNYWKGKNAPCKTTTLPKLAKKGLDLRPLFTSIDEIHKRGTINHVVRHFLTIDLISSESITPKVKRMLARRILDDIDADWTPCDQRLFFSEIENEQTPNLWIEELPKLNPRPRRVNGSYLINYDPYNMLSLVSWLISITPFYYSKPYDLERLTIDLLSSALCLMALGSTSNSKNFGAPAYSYQSKYLTLVPELALVGDKSIIEPTIERLLTEIPTICPDQKSDPHQVLNRSARNIYKSYDTWLKRYGLSKQEIAIAMGFCNLEIAQKLKLFSY